MRKNKKLVSFFIVLLILSSFISYKAGKNASVFSSTKSDDKFVDYGSFKPFLDIIKEKYYFDIDYDKMNTEVKKAMFKSLGDPYTQYMTEEDMKQLKRTSTSKFIGIGVQVSVNEKGEVVVISPIKNGPSEKAGILAEDIIVKINDEEVKKNDLETNIKLIRGDEKIGTPVKITVKRVKDGKEELLDFDIKREEITTETVHHKMLENNILYVSISTFAEKTGDDFETAVDDGIKNGAKSIIIDLRNNPGGLLTAVKQVADKILPESVIMKTVNSKGKESFEKATKGEVDLPILVLINKGSASASEVLSVALRDNGKAKLVGEKSFGKGIIQSIFPVDNHGKAEGVKITIAEYFGPKGTKINKVGLEPDYFVEQKDVRKIGLDHIKEDLQLQKAIELLK